jgi:hypothetical protein
MARAFVVGPSVNWLVKNDLSLTIGANIKSKSESALDNWQFDDCRSCNPYPPFTTYTSQGQSFVPGSLGLGGLEPLGRFRAGPIGAAWSENEVHFTMKYRF